MDKNKATLVHNHGVLKTLIKMAGPMLVGTIAMNVYNLTDTWFVSRLGKVQLAGIGFTFPVIMIVSFVARGLGTGGMAKVSRACGANNKKEARVMATNSLIIAFLLSIVLAIIGVYTMEPLFTRLGATAEVMPYISDYMKIWYIGLLSICFLMVGNPIVLGTGDSKATSTAICLSMVLNTILDPVLIFGFAGIPAMGMKGAALATVISQSSAAAWIIYILNKKHKLIAFTVMSIKDRLKVWAALMEYAVPGVLSGILIPISGAFITRIVAGYGIDAVAATSAAGRIEMFAFMIPMTIGMSLVPFISQNSGAGETGRIKEAFNITMSFAVGYGLFIAIVFFFTIPFMAACFTKDAHVQNIIINYTRIISIGYGLMETHRYGGFFLVGTGKPVASAILNVVRCTVILIPLTLLGSHLGGLNGVFVGRVSAEVLSGCLAMFWSWMVIRQHSKPMPVVAAEVCRS